MSQRRSTKYKPKLTISTKNNSLRFRYNLSSPRIARIKASGKSEKSPEEILSKLTMIVTPKPPSRIPSRSPFITRPQNLSLSKLLPLRRTSVHRILSKGKNTKRLNKTKDTQVNISNSMLPLPQDFNCFITQLLDIFSTAESLVDYFFIDRREPIKFNDFSESCFSIGLNVFFSDLETIFEEAVKENCIIRKGFLKKIITIQNNEEKVLERRESVDRHTLSSIMNKILPCDKDNYSEKTKKILGIVKNAKGPDDLLAKIQTEVDEPNLSTSELSLLIEYSKVQKKKTKKDDLNLTTKLNGSPYALIPCSVAYNKHL